MLVETLFALFVALMPAAALVVAMKTLRGRVGAARVQTIIFLVAPVSAFIVGMYDNGGAVVASVGSIGFAGVGALMLWKSLSASVAEPALVAVGPKYSWAGRLKVAGVVYLLLALMILASILG